MPARVGVIGAGLIGGSICKTLRSVGFEHIVVTSASQSTRDEVRVAGFDVVDTVHDLVLAADIVFVCVPLTVQMGVFGQIIDAVNSSGRRDLIVTDVSSVKGEDADTAKKLFSQAGVVFIPGHPMAGTEHSGFSASTETLFMGSTWVLCPTIGEGVEWVQVAQLVLAMKAKLSVVDVDHHDSAVASISHLPYVMAATLLNVLPDGDDQALALRLAAGSFRDGTRVASSEPWLSTSMVSFNSANVARLLRDAGQIMNDMVAALDAGNNQIIHDFFVEAHARRARYEDLKASSSSQENIFPEVSVTRRCMNECQRGSLITSMSHTDDVWTVTFE